MITNLQKQYASQIAGLHISGISTGFISSLRSGFVSVLYEAIAEDENSFGFVALDDDEVLGFVAFTTNLSKLYKYVALKKGFKFAFILARKMTSWKFFKKICGNIFYPGKMKSLDLPDAELLSIVIASQGRGKGLATQLVEKGFEECANRGIDKVKVLVASANEPANKLYLKCGFKLAGQIDSHGVISNIYVAQIN